MSETSRAAALQASPNAAGSDYGALDGLAEAFGRNILGAGCDTVSCTMHARNDMGRNVFHGLLSPAPYDAAPCGD